MKILAIDTSSSICSTAILDDEVLIDKNELNNGRTHSENLMPLIDELLKRNNITVKDINLLACSVGPGSFTGIRIGVASIKAIAEVLKIKVAGVTSLETLAKNVKDADTIVSLIDARNNQVYCGIFDRKCNKKEEYIADDINEVIKNLKKYDKITFVGSGAVLHKDLLKEELENVKFSDLNEQSAENVGKIGYKKYLENDLCDADSILPIYLRKSQAERLKNK
ncbi:MAG TPA: tRNA (adenosine(37)-N6)-threonylcarbamoyltransferase complex dimerization subunit type 1 TsaB [Candidatus Scatovivens faecipullorum]|nr:tRNA (adenosine(37)-N6)-threonylcarbamoyltransferase complex dimerization subunit type 1 TsaB [Candidatus Scatovivens faecipullorum]